jgi:hypothetical protein
MDKEEKFTKTFRHFNQGAFMLIAFPDQPFCWASCRRAIEHGFSLNQANGARGWAIGDSYKSAARENKLGAMTAEVIEFIQAAESAQSGKTK